MFAKLSQFPGGVGLAAAALLALGLGLSPTPAEAHCKGKHTGNHPHCGGGEDPPPTAFNPEIVWRESNTTIKIANGDGTNATTILSDKNFAGPIGNVA